MKWALIFSFLLLGGCAWPPSKCGSIPSPAGIPPQGCSNQVDTTTCSDGTPCSGSSLVVDTAHSGLHMTDPKRACVLFDVKGNGVPVCVSWPEHGSGNAWLVDDADGVGVVDSGKDLLGNFSSHSIADRAPKPNNQNPNGFLALAWYDQLPQGGDANLIIDKRDKIWSKLKLWIDDHCYKTPDVACASLPDELHALEEYGINSISLIYAYADGHTDNFRNEFKFSAVLNPDAETNPLNEKGEVCCDLHQQSSIDERLIFDVHW